MTILREFREHPARVLDRLVDGELGQSERRDLLAAFDDEPGAWRQCALAFLEAQSWGWQLSRVASEPIVAQVTAAKSATTLAEPAARGGRMQSALWSAAFAASVLVAFLSGTWAGNRNAAEPLVAKATAPNSAQGSATAPTKQAENDAYPQDTSDDFPSDKPREMLTFKPYGRDEAIDLPIVESDEQAALEAAETPLALSGELINQFERDGFVVDHQQRLWPVELPDGRSVLVPVEEVNIQAPPTQKL